MDCVYVAEDLGTQDTLLMSPASFRRFLKPWMRKMIDLIHSFGVRVMHHDDGAIRPLLPELIEIGVDVLNPIQWRCKGMEREGLTRDFGKSLVFHGGVDNQQTLPFGTPDDVKREVAENIRIFSKGKGYIVVALATIYSRIPPPPISWRCMKPSTNTLPEPTENCKLIVTSPRSAGILPAVAGTSRSRQRAGDAHARAGKTPALRKHFVTIFCSLHWELCRRHHTP